MQIPRPKQTGLTGYSSGVSTHRSGCEQFPCGRLTATLQPRAEARIVRASRIVSTDSPKCWSKAGGISSVLDGLERVQRPPGDLKQGFGELEDPLLRQAVTRLAAGAGRTKCLITTRFPVPDLHRWEGCGYTQLKVDHLDRVSARQLLRRHGVRGDDLALDAVLDEYGSHALTLDHVGAYLAEFCGRRSRLGRPGGGAPARLQHPRRA